MTDDTIPVPAGFSESDFEAYAPSKWSSNMYTLQRRSVKDKLDKLGRQLDSLFKQNEINLVSHLSDEYPSLWNKKRVDKQWLFFSRDLSAKKELQDVIDTEKTLAETLVDPTPLYKHIFIGVAVDESAVSVGIYLHFDAWVDRKNILALIDNLDKGQEFINICSSLPDNFEFSISENEPVAPLTLTSEILKKIVSDFNENRGWMFFGKKVLKDQVISSNSNFFNQIIDDVTALLPVYNFMAWSTENDALSLDSIVLQKKQQIEAKHQVLEDERHKREESHKDTVLKRQESKEALKQDMLEEQEWRQKERAKRRAAAIAKRAAAEAAWNSTVANKKERINSSFVKKDVLDKKQDNKKQEDKIIPHYDKNDKNRVSTKKNKDRRDKFSDRKSHESGRRFSKSKSRKPPVHVSDERKADVKIGDNVLVSGGFLNGRKGIVQSIDEKGYLVVSFGMLSSRVNRQDVKGLGPAV